MGFWSTLGKIALPVAGIAAAPFTGGTSLLGTLGSVGGKIASGINAAQPALSALGNVASGAAKGSADQRMAEGNQALGYAGLAQGAARDKFAADLAGANAQFGAGMQGAQFNRDGQDRSRKSAMLSSLLGGIQDFQATPGNPAVAARMGQTTGGLRPSALTGNKEALMALLSQPEIAAPEYQAPSPYVAPALPQMPQQGMGEKILGGIGLGGSILGAIGQVGRQPSQESRVGIQNPSVVRGGTSFLDPNKLGGELFDTGTGQMIRLPQDPSLALFDPRVRDSVRF